VIWYGARSVSFVRVFFHGKNTTAGRLPRRDTRNLCRRLALGKQPHPFFSGARCPIDIGRQARHIAGLLLGLRWTFIPASTHRKFANPGLSAFSERPTRLEIQRPTTWHVSRVRGARYRACDRGTAKFFSRKTVSRTPRIPAAAGGAWVTRIGATDVLDSMRVCLQRKPLEGFGGFKGTAFEREQRLLAQSQSRGMGCLAVGRKVVWPMGSHLWATVPAKIRPRPSFLVAAIHIGVRPSSGAFRPSVGSQLVI